MSKSQLVLAEVRTESKTNKILWFFEPKELVTGEPFDIYLTFKNLETSEFLGGKCKIKIAPPNLIALHSHEVNLPPIKPKKSKTVVLKDLIVPFSGYVNVSFVSVEDVKGNSVSLEGEPDGGLMITSHEELYQKYAVLVAIFFSVLATILTTINVLVSIFK